MEQPVIELVDVRKSFAMPGGEERVDVLDIPEFRLDAGAHCALEGHSGSGKSTLLNVISGIQRADSGRVVICGTDIGSLPEPVRDRVRADRLGLVFQQFNLLPGFTALENVLVAMAFGSGRTDRARATDLLSAVGLGHRLHHKPAELSVGQQQRVAVARALVSRPRIVFADEPTGNLDSKSGAEILGFMQRAVKEFGQTIVMVTHDPVAASYADRVLFLADGKLVNEINNPTAATVIDYMKSIGD